MAVGWQVHSKKLDLRYAMSYKQMKIEIRAEVKLRICVNARRENLDKKF